MTDYYINDNKKRKTIKKVFYIVSALIILFLLFSIAVGFIYELIQINEIGKNYVSIFWKNFSVKILTQIFSLIVVFFVFYFNNLIIKNNLVRILGNISIFSKNIINFIISFILALLSSSYFEKALYIKFLTSINSKPFNIKDPIFHKDIGYYIFERPFYLSIANIFLWLIIFVIIYTLLVYIISSGTGIANPKGWGILADNKVKKHLFVNLILFFIIKLWTFKYEMEGLLYSFFGEVIGVGYTDYYIRLNYYRLSYIVVTIIIILSIIFFIKKQYMNVAKVMLSFAAYWLLGNIVALAFQYFVVSPNEIVYERPFLNNNIKFTRLAYNLDNITEKKFDIDTSSTLTIADINNNKSTIDNIRITDFPTTLDIQNQIQRFKQYYIFNDADIARYTINGKTRAVFISAREINYQGIPTKTYINQRLQYTHGYGIVMSPLSDITKEGQPKFIIKDIPVKSIEGAPIVTQPRIYYGESTNQYVIVNTKEDEIDYPEGDSNKLFRYDGNGGIRLSFLNRLLFSYKYQDLRMLISTGINSNSKLLINRNIIDRAKMVAPFFEYDNDPYILIDKKGKLYWVLDAYTTTKFYPYSEPLESGVNYIRNSVKVIIDAYNGSLKFYIVDKNDPIVNVYKSIYPKLFETNSIPTDLAEHIRYPELIFKIQSEMLKRYHMTNVNVFYNKEDLWDIGKHKSSDGSIDKIPPYYSIVTLPNETKEEMILMVPFTPLKYNTMIAWLAARCDGENYGKLVLFKFTKGSTVYGPLQIENMIDQDPSISKDLSLWDQGGSKVIRGNLLILPIGNKLLYIEPIYIASDNTSALPEVKRVIASYNGKVVMGESLSDSLSLLIGSQIDLQEIKNVNNAPDTTTDNNSIIKNDEILKEIINNFEKAKQSLKSGDLEEFGKLFKKLDEQIQKIK
ncbi:UPF0182 family protein [Caldicellulosiruptoraceae bacterium PP1]